MSELKHSKRKQLGNQVIDVQEFKAITDKEENLQRQCEQLLDLMKVIYYRVPDIVYKNRSPHIRKLVSKYLKGMPDLLILKPYDDIYLKAMAVELKTKKGRLTQSQKTFQKRLPLIVVRSFEQFQKELNNFLED